MDLDASLRRRVRWIVDLPDGAIKSAVMTTQIAWEVEKLSVTDND